MSSNYTVPRRTLEDRHCSKHDLRNELRVVVRHVDEAIQRGWYDLGHPTVKNEVLSCTNRMTQLMGALVEKRQNHEPDYHAHCSFEFLQYYWAR